MKNKLSILFAVSFLLILSSSNANPVIPVNPDQPIELKYAGSIDNNPVYQLQLLNKDLKGKVQVSFSDKNGLTLYSETLTASNLTRRFLINRDDLGNDPVRVEISFSGNKNTVLYEINSTTHTLTENIVTRIN